MQKGFARNSENLNTKGITSLSHVFDNSAQRTETSHFRGKSVTSDMSITYILLSSHDLKIQSDGNVS